MSLVTLDARRQRSKHPNVPIRFPVACSEMITFTLVGLLLDYGFDTPPAFTIVLAFLGAAGAFFL